MDVATGAIGSLNRRLGELLNMDGMEQRTKDDIKFMMSKLEDTQIALLRVAEVPPDLLNMEGKHWFHEVRETSYDIEDDLDILHLQMNTSRSTAVEITNIRKQVEALRIQPEMYIAENALIGIEEPWSKLYKRLADGDDDTSKQHLRIIPVLGSRGMGKTTLVKEVYGTPNVPFHCRAFVSMGPNPDMKKILKKVLHHLSPENFKNINEPITVETLRKFLESKRFLIVFDDIVDMESWDSIRPALVDSKCGSRVIAITRSSEVAMKANSDIYELQPLSDQNSKKLLSTVLNTKGIYLDNNQLAQIFNKNDEKKCGGVPLSIHIMASLIVHTKQMDKLSTVYNMYCLYYDLPSHLKTCLLYLSIFQGDDLNEKDVLIRMWIAEDFIHQDPGTALFEVGERYFNELVSRNMIQPLLMYDTECLEGFRVNDALADLIRWLIREQNFLTIFDKEPYTFSQQSNVRRFAIQKMRLTEEHKISMGKLTKLRSFNSTRCLNLTSLPISSFKGLRVLALVCCRFAYDQDLKEIKSLHHLRYLGLAGTNISDLPIDNLKLLQTLDVRGTGTKELPRAIFGLTQLMSLRADQKTRVTSSILKLTSLRNLQAYSVDSDRSLKFVEELGCLKELRVMKTGFHELNESLEQHFVKSLCELHKINILEVWCSSLKRTVMLKGWSPPHCLRHLVLLGIGFNRMPEWINSESLPNLSNLCVAVEVLEDPDLQNLGRLRQLHCLNLVIEDDNNTSIAVRGDSFQKLSLCTMNRPPAFLLRGDTMARLEILQFVVKVNTVKEIVRNIDPSIRNDPSLEQVQIIVILNCWAASDTEVKDAEDMLRDIHPNCEVIKQHTYNDDIQRKLLGEKLRAKNPQLHLLERELARMGANQEFMRRIQLDKELSLIDSHLDALQRDLNRMWANQNRL